MTGNEKLVVQLYIAEEGISSYEDLIFFRENLNRWWPVGFNAVRKILALFLLTMLAILDIFH